MVVNSDKLKEIIAYATIECYYCPLSCGGGLNSCGKNNNESCEEIMLEWLQESDVVKALEEGAHIINDKIVFPPQPLPDDFILNVPCDYSGQCDPSCTYFNKCPFEDD